MNPLVIYGAGGLAREVLTVIDDVNRKAPTWECLGFLDDREGSPASELGGLPILGGKDWLKGVDRKPLVVIGVGSPAAKRRIGLTLDELSVQSPVLIHPTAVVSAKVRLLPGTIVTAGCILTTDIRVGRHVILNLVSTVGHDSVLGDYVTIAPGVNISGNVTIGEGCDIGTGAKIIQGKTIGGWSVVGAGAVVTADLPANCTAVGMPAKPIKQRDSGWHL